MRQSKIKSVYIKFDKLLHDTGRAILVRVNGSEHWIPKKLCRNLIVNRKLGGNLSIPTFFAEKIGINDAMPHVEVEHHVPDLVSKQAIHDNSLFK